MAYTQKKIKKKVGALQRAWGKFSVVPYRLGRRIVKGFNAKTGKFVFKKSK
jgi:hypothetical protein